MQDIQVRVIPGPKPDALDAVCEASRRGLGKLQSEWFSSGAWAQCNGFPILGHGRRKDAQREAGAAWARDEIRRRAAA